MRPLFTGQTEHGPHGRSSRAEALAPVLTSPPHGVALTQSGQFVTADAGGSIIGINPTSGNPTSGNRTLLSGVTGPGFTYPYGIAVDASDKLLITDPGDPAFGTGLDPLFP